MKKLLNKMQNIAKDMKKSNKGFTMVELIIVIAIIAILAAVIAPQYLRFVEDARESNDIQAAALIEEAIIIAIADDSSKFSGVTSVTWDSNGTGALSTNAGTGNTAAIPAIQSIIGEDSIEAESANGKKIDFTWTVDIANGSVDLATGSNDTANLGVAVS